MKELKEFLLFATALGNALGESLKDGKIDVTDMVTLWRPISTAGDAFEGIAKILEEIKALDEAKTKELAAFIKANFNIPQDSVELAVESALELAVGILKFVTLIGAKK
jgi:hypothetical protein